MRLHLHVNFTHMNVAQAPNEQVLRYLKRANRDAPDIAAHDSIPNPYYQCGCHPDIVERVWDQIGAAMPAECRCLVTGMPALVHPAAGRIEAPCVDSARACFGISIAKNTAGRSLCVYRPRMPPGSTVSLRMRKGRVTPHRVERS